MNGEDDEAEGSRSLPTKQIKISIQLSFHDEDEVGGQKWLKRSSCDFSIRITTIVKEKYRGLLLSNLPLQWKY